MFYRFNRPFENWLVSRASTIVASSDAYLESSIPLRRFRHKCQVEPLQIEIERIPKKFRDAPKTQRLPGEGLRLLCVGRLTYYKSFSTAIEAAAIIPGSELRIVGEGEERSNLTALIDNLGVVHRVTLLGDLRDEEVWAQFTWCDVHMLPSRE